MKKKYLRRGVALVVLAGGIFLYAQNNQQEQAPSEEVVVEKIPFFVQTASIDDLSSVSKITKNGTVMGAQEISISSQVFGRVSSLPVRAGEEVKKGEMVVRLEDTSANASFQALRSQVQLNTTRSSYDLSVTQLEQAIVDAKNALEQAKAQYASIRQQWSTTATLQTQQLQAQIAKAQLDYQSLVTSNQQTIQNYINTTKNIARDVELLYRDISTSTDELLGVSPLHQGTNDYFEQSLGAQNTSTKFEAQHELRVLLGKQSMFTNTTSNITESNLLSHLQDLKQNIQHLIPVLDKTEVMLQYTTETSTLPQAQINGYKSAIDAYQLQVQSKSSALTEQINSMQSFLSTYHTSQSSALKQKELVEQQAKVTTSTLQDNEELARLQVERAQASYDQAIKSKQKNISSLQNSIAQAQIAVDEASDQLDKFMITAPIDGTIGSVLVDVWEEISAGSQLVTIKSTNSQQVEISLTQEELSFVEVWQEVKVYNRDQEVSGIVTSISKSANQNFSYAAVVELMKTVDLFWELVRVEIDVRTDYPLIPLNVVTILNNNEWLINRRDGTKIGPLRVRLGKVWGDLIEIRTHLDKDMVIIISDVKNYNSQRHTLEQQK